MDVGETLGCVSQLCPRLKHGFTRMAVAWRIVLRPFPFHEMALGSANMRSLSGEVSPQISRAVTNGL